MDTDKHSLALPRTAQLPINRCNLPAKILGSLQFQRYPQPLTIDGTRELHRDLFLRLDALDNASQRAQQFIDYMSVHFCLHAPDEAGFDPACRIDRHKADYLRLLRGWSFDSEGREGAVLKGWVESRFGLIPRFHHGPIRHGEDENYRRYQLACADGLYNTNALFDQLDLLYSYGQYELQSAGKHLTLYRGSNATEQLGPDMLLLNNLNSFSRDRERADEFGDVVWQIEVPAAKVFFYAELLPSYLKAEREVMVLGGLYRAKQVV